VRDTLGEDVYNAVNAFFRDASREMSAVRDSVVLVDTLDVLIDQISPECYHALRSHLQAEHERISDELLNQRDVTAEIAERIVAKRAEFANLPLGERGIETYIGLRRVYGRGCNGMAQSKRSENEAHIHHEWRKRVKYFWHHCEMLEPVWPPLFADYAVELHLLSDFLGDAHDLAVLRDTVLANPDWLAATQREPLVALLTNREAALYQRAYPVGERLFGLQGDALWQWVERIWGSWQRIAVETTQLLTQQILSDRFLSVADAAALLDIPIDQLRADLRAGQRVGYKVGGRWVLDRTEL
jgi:CHAD domain-containing protein